MNIYSIDNQPSGFYVYAYLRKDGTPYYIGKGKDNRAWFKQNNEIGKPNDPIRIIIVESNLTNVGALAIERRLIRWYGRLDKGTGILRNKTDGGDGGPGAKLGTVLSQETKNKISIAHMGKKSKPMSDYSKKILSESLRGKNKGKIRTEEQRKNMSLVMKNRINRPAVTEETKLKISRTLTGRKRGPHSEKHKENMRKPRLAIQCIHCGKLGGISQMKRWHQSNCKLNTKTGK